MNAGPPEIRGITVCITVFATSTTLVELVITHNVFFNQVLYNLKIKSTMSFSLYITNNETEKFKKARGVISRDIPGAAA